MAEQKKFYHDIDLVQNQLKNAVWHQLSAPPSSPVNGQVYYNTTQSRPYYWDAPGNAWVPFGGLDTNIYNSDGSLTANRYVTMGSFTLAFQYGVSFGGVYVGRGSGEYGENTIVGSAAMGTANTGNFNVGVGNSVFGINTTGNQNTAVGSQAMRDNTSGTRNVAVGRKALMVNQSGSWNTAVGIWALVDEIGSYNTSIGGYNGAGTAANALANNHNFLGGHAAGFNLSGSNNNVLVGSYTGYDITAANNNIFLGYNTGRGITTGSGNVVIGAGITGLDAATTNNIILGTDGVIKARSFASGNWVFQNGGTFADAGYLMDIQGTLRATNTVTFGSLSGTGTRMVVADANGVLSTQAIPSGSTGVTYTASNGLYIDGSNVIKLGGALSETTYINNSGYTLTFAADIYIADMRIGRGPGNQVTNTTIGVYAAYSNSTGSNNTFVGYSAGYYNTTAGANTYVGFYAGRTSTGANNTYIGQLSGGGNSVNANTASFNTAVGQNTMSRIETGQFNTVVGSASFGPATSADRNTIVGSHAFTSITTGIRNVGLGVGVGQGNDGSYNTFLGTYAGRSSSGSNNVFIGYYAGGDQWGSLSNQLVIAISNTLTPLVHGDFSLATLKINGTFSVTNVSQDDALTKILVWDDATKEFKYRSAATLGGGGGGGSVGSLDQVLTVGNTTAQKIIWQDAGLGIVTTEMKPSNNGTVYPGWGKASYFSTGWGVFPGVNASGRPNVVGTFWGYNHNTGGGRVDAAEASFGFRTETHYEIGSVPAFEFHLPEFQGTDGVIHRLFSFYVDKTGATPAGPQLNGKGLLFSQWDDGNFNWGEITSNLIQFYNHADVTGSKFLLGNKAWAVGDTWSIYPISSEYTYIGRESPTTLTWTVFRDNVAIGDATSESTNRRLFAYGWTKLENKFNAVAALTVKQYSTNARIAEFFNGDTEETIIYKQALKLVNGTTALRPSPENGMLRYNTDTNKLEGVENGVWTNLIGGGGVGTLDQVLVAGNTTDENIVFDKTFAEPVSGAVTKEWMRFEPLVKTAYAVPFVFTQSSTKFNGYMDEVFNFGWNLSPGGSSYLAGKAGIGESWESYYRPASEQMVEKHEFYINPVGEQIRIGSYTIFTSTDTIDYYQTVSRYYLYVPGSNNTRQYFMVQPNGTGAGLNVGYDAVAAISLGYDTVTGANLNLYGSAVSRLIHNIEDWNGPSYQALPGLIRLKGNNGSLVSENYTGWTLGTTTWPFQHIYSNNIGADNWFIPTYYGTKVILSTNLSADMAPNAPLRIVTNNNIGGQPQIFVLEHNGTKDASIAAANRFHGGGWGEAAVMMGVNSSYGYFGMEGNGNYNPDLYIYNKGLNKSIIFQTNGGNHLKLTSAGRLLLQTAPANDDTLTQVIVRDPSTGELKYRTASTLAGTGGTLEQVLTAGNSTTKNIVFDVSLAEPSEGNAVTRNWITIDNLVKTSGRGAWDRVPFVINHSATKQLGQVNEVITFGWNTDAGGGNQVAGLPAIGESWESNFTIGGGRVMEKHEIYVSPGGVQTRLGSYTIDTVSNTGNFYHTIAEFFLKRMDMDRAYLSASYGQLYFGTNISDNKGIQMTYSDAAGGTFTLQQNGMTAPEPEFRINNFTVLSGPGFVSRYLVGDQLYFRFRGVNGAVYPETDNALNLGINGLEWKQVWAKDLIARNRMFLISTPILNNTATQILVRNSTTWEIEYRDVASITGGSASVSAVTRSDYDYDITGSRNSSNKVFTLSANFTAGTTRVFVNGIRLTRGASYDYVETGTNQITFTNAPDAGDLITVDYITP